MLSLPRVTNPSSLYAESARLRLETGIEVEALIRAAPGQSRPRCLLLHGNPGSLLDWEHVVPLLADVADVAAVDLPGFGRSPRPGAQPHHLSLDRLAEHVIAVTGALGWNEPVYLVGHSHGGGVAQAAAARRPDRVAGLVLLGSLGAPAQLSYRLLALPGAAAVAAAAGRLFGFSRLRPVTRALLGRAMHDIFHPEPVSAAQRERRLSLFAERPEVLLSMVHVALGAPCSQLLAGATRIRCPVLFIHGCDDALVPEKCARTIHERITGAGGQSLFSSLPGAGHMLITFQAEAVSAEITRFLPSHTRV
jgi:pimeloyl-ACP methyl ester carboxylesterase